LSDVGYLFDTNVLSEVNRRQPNERVLAFVRGLSNEHTFISVLTVGELRRGAVLKRRTDAGHADRLDAWIASIETDYGPRILPVDLSTAQRWGELAAERSRPLVDALIAATAMVHDLTLVTRNTRDFADVGVALVNPWG
jgi:predicted nucleic acid-binding protein